jgi:uncharacterized 2Fe-2S/4Fe-4S cluster protein (DUF4445 family)
MSQHNYSPNGSGDGAEHLVIFMPSGRRGRVRHGENLLDAARHMGVEIESICGGRLTCGKCRCALKKAILPNTP